MYIGSKLSGLRITRKKRKVEILEITGVI